MPREHTIMPPAKAIKTERTHEENQERAYIAASRRSDRSLEARVESARRASEIHKRRTGRALRITEQDVLNEEMYEEEDDDMPFHYRRLTHHLQTSSPDFNKRLSAYLTNNVAMRSAVEIALRDSYQPYAQNTAFGGNGAMFGAPMFTHPGQQQMFQPPSSQTMPQSQAIPQSPTVRSPTSYRHAPYPPRPQKQEQAVHSSHQRSASTSQSSQSTVNTGNTPTTVADNDRRMSMPAVSSSSNSSVDIKSSPQPAKIAKARPSFPAGSFSQSSILKGSFGEQTPSENNQPLADNNLMNNNNNNNYYGAMTTQLPGDVQGLLGSTMMSNDELTSMMGGNYGNLFNFDTQLPQTISLGKSQNYPTYEGVHSTIAPAAPTENLASLDEYSSSTFFEDAIKTENEPTPDEFCPGNEGWADMINFDTYPTSSQ